ncbi:MAG: hypothetical protein MSC43_02390 [Clostridiales bacterium]|nr:hypothetical protein [Clostridiales bacterium]
MEPYCDQNFYEQDYHGKAIAAADLLKTLTEATYLIDTATNGMIGNLKDWPEYTQKRVKMATCAQADYSHEYGDIEESLGILGGYTIGDVSVSSGGGGKQSQDPLVRHYRLCQKAITYLLPTGLLDRRLR